MGGGGLGGAVVWNAVTGPLAGRIKAAALQQAVISYESVIRNHKFKEPLLEAFGLPSDTPDDLAVATLAYNDPLYRTRLLAAEKAAAGSHLLPEVLFVHGDADENHLYSENPIALSRLLGGCGVPFAFQTFPGVGHATYQLGEEAARPITDFFRTRFSLERR
jgi:acetyl esterase/lipase